MLFHLRRHGSLAAAAEAVPPLDGSYPVERLGEIAGRVRSDVTMQPGRATFPSQAREIEPLLARRHVGLALDPEWRVGPTERPGGGRIGTVDGSEIVRAEISGPRADAEGLGAALGDELLEHGAAQILRELYADA